VKEVGKRKLKVEYVPVAIEEDRIILSKPVLRQVDYNPEVKSFVGVRRGDWVTLHWNYACEVITSRQLRNLAKYTELDIRSTNRILRAFSRRAD